MMDNLTQSDVKDLVFLIDKDFGLERKQEEDAFNYQAVINWLQREIQILLNKDLQKLLNILYRIDISEDKTKEVLAMSNHDQMAEMFTKLIVQRELQKVETRKKYRSE